MRRLILPLALMTLAGCTLQPTEKRLQIQAREAARLEADLAGFTAGKPVNCMMSRDARGPEAYGDHSLIFHAGRNLIYRNDTIGSCRGVGRGEALIIRQTSSQMCAGDIARTADLVAGFETGSCALGQFIPYRRTRP